MKKIKLIAAIAGVLLICAALYYWHWIRTPEYLIGKAIQSVTEALYKNSGEGNSAAAFKLLVLGNSFASQVELSVEGVPMAHGTLSDEELVSHISRGRMALRYIHIDILDSQITVKDDDNAEVFMDIMVKAASDKGGKEVFNDIFHLKATLIRSEEDGKWRFASCRSMQLLQK